MVLTAFKEKKNVPAPLSILASTPNFVRGFGIEREFYTGNDGKPHYGAVETPFRDYLITLAKWYRDGLLDRDWAALTQAQLDQKMTGGTAGSSAGSLDAGMAAWTSAGRAANPKYTLIAAKPPVVRRANSIIQTIDNNYSGSGCAITTANKYVELSTRMLDWGYSDEGSLFHNFGIEGVSYVMENGRPAYTDLIMKNPDGWSMVYALSAYARSPYSGPFIQSLVFQEQYFTLREQNAAVELWRQPDPFRNKLPPISRDQTESLEFDRIMGEIDRYVSEMIVKFIQGTESLSNWESYVDTINSMGMERVLAIQSAALARYNTR